MLCRCITVGRREILLRGLGQKPRLQRRGPELLPVGVCGAGECFFFLVCRGLFTFAFCILIEEVTTNWLSISRCEVPLTGRALGRFGGDFLPIGLLSVLLTSLLTSRLRPQGG